MINYEVQVPGYGPIDSPILLFGEAPAKNEVFEGKPFVGCYDSETEVLTTRGWLKSDEIQKNDLFYTLNLLTEEIQTSEAVEIIRTTYSGAMYKVRTNQVDLLVTPDHQMVVKPIVKNLPKAFSPLRLMLALDVFGKQMHYKKNGIWKGEDAKFIRIGDKKYKIEAFLYYIGFYIAEGWMRKNPRSKSEESEICVSQKSTEIAGKVLAALNEMQEQYKIWVRDENSMGTIVLHSESLAEYLKPLGDTYTKYIPHHLLNLSSRLLEYLLEGLMDGDGCDRHYYTVSSRLRDDFQELCLKVGKSARYSSRMRSSVLKDGRSIIATTPCYELGINTSQNSPRVSAKRAKRDESIIFEEQWIKYNGPIWCVSLKKNHTLYVRRNGIPVWSGNSAGRFLTMILNLAGLSRDDLYITNVSKIRAPNDKMELLESRHPDVYSEQVKIMIEEINDLPNPKIIVAMGAHALKNLTNVRGIINWRGCPTPPIDAIKHDCVVIPTYHPSILHYNYKLWVLIVADFIKVKRIQDEGFKFKFPTWKFITRPSFQQVMDTLDLIKEKGYAVVDVETPHNLLSCIGFAWSRSEAICIPFFWGTGRNYWSFEEEYAIWEKISDVCSVIDLSAQNTLFDWRILYEHNIHLKKPKWDSLLMHHCLYSEMPHTLDIITSIYTDLPFTKKDEDEEKGSVLKVGSEQKHWDYNCYDCIGTFWAIEELEKELIEEGMMPVYQSLYADVVMPLFEMNMRGVPVDMTRLQKVQEEYLILIEQYRQQIKEETGYEIKLDAAEQKKDPNEDTINIGSPQQVADLLFNKLGMIPYKGKSTDKKAMEKLAYKYQTEVPNLIINIRSAKKSLSLFSEENIIDGKVKCEYALHRTNTGRIASRKGRGRGGMNLQNVKTGETRRFFIPLPGHVMVCADQKQAEAMMVAWYARDSGMQKLINSGESIHIAYGKSVYGPNFDKGHPLYRVVKSLVHGGDYGLGPRTFSINAGLPFAEGKRHLEDFHRRFPGIRKNFHEYVKDEIRRCRTLYNPFGRREIFLDHIDDTAFRAGYAFLPQSTVTDINKTALKRIHRHYIVLLETHDGLALSVPEKEVMIAAEALQEAYNVEFKVWEEIHTIPIEISFGSNWEDQIVIDI